MTEMNMRGGYMLCEDVGLWECAVAGKLERRFRFISRKIRNGGETLKCHKVVRQVSSCLTSIYDQSTKGFLGGNLPKVELVPKTPAELFHGAKWKVNISRLKCFDIFFLSIGGWCRSQKEYDSIEVDRKNLQLISSANQIVKIHWMPCSLGKERVTGEQMLLSGLWVTETIAAFGKKTRHQSLHIQSIIFSFFGLIIDWIGIYLLSPSLCGLNPETSASSHSLKTCRLGFG